MESDWNTIAMLQSIVEELRNENTILDSKHKKVKKSLETLIEIAVKYVPPNILNPILTELNASVGLTLSNS